MPAWAPGTSLFSPFPQGGAGHSHARIAENMVVRSPRAAPHQEEHTLAWAPNRASIPGAPCTSSALGTRQSPPSTPVSSHAKQESVWGTMSPTHCPNRDCNPDPKTILTSFSFPSGALPLSWVPSTFTCLCWDSVPANKLATHCSWVPSLKSKPLLPEVTPRGGPLGH